jgi:hypothetical protein
MEIRIYFEGNKLLKTGFASFFLELKTAAREADSEIEFIPARNGTSDYGKALRSHPHAWNILLKDSEEEMPKSPATLCERHGIDPKLVADVFWMVELMESWFLADTDALAKYYGRNFSVSAIRKTKDVERIAKSEVLKRLKRATGNKYHKVTHAPHLLGLLNPERVQEHASHCRKLFDTVRARLQRS